MRSTPMITDAKPLDRYVVRVSFEDGTAADVDLSYLPDYGGVFEPLRDLGYFRRVDNRRSTAFPSSGSR